jgi:curli biogenesis system outer membrane secretion channel CsgG
MDMNGKSLVIRFGLAALVGFAFLVNTSTAGSKGNKSDTADKAETSSDSKTGQTESSSEVDANEALGGLRYRIMVTQFEDRSAYGGLANMTISSAWQEMLTQALHESGKFLVVAGKDERNEAKEEITFVESEWSQNGKSAPEKGHLATAQLLVKGTIVSVQETNSQGGKTGILGVPIIDLRRQSAEIRMIVKIYEAQTGLVVASKEIVGKSASIGVGAWNLPGNTSVAFGNNKNLAKAASHALKQSVELCSAQLSRIEWLGSIMSVKSNGDILINRGEREGIHSDLEFVVGMAETMEDPETGEMLGYDKTELGRIRVDQVFEKYSVCKLINGDGKQLKKEQSVWVATTL